MAEKFLSEGWFAKVAELNAAAGTLNLPPALAAAVVNAEVTGDVPKQLHLKDGKVAQGLVVDAPSKIIIDGETLRSLIEAKDPNVAIEAFMMGKIRVEGDMSQVMSLQSTRPTPEQKALFKQMLAMTVF